MGRISNTEIVRRHAHKTAKPTILALEPRLMFDGAAVADAAAAVDAAIKAVPAPVVVCEADPAKDNGKKEVVFIDTSVADYKTLEAGIKAGVEIVEIGGGASGLAQMAQWAEIHHDYDAIHVLSHGAEGAVTLGTDIITNASLSNATAKAELEIVGKALTADGDLLLYGCDVAKGADGQAFLTNLAAVTGADVAASDDATGAAAKGGDWTLETHSGDVASTAFAPAMYQSVLNLNGTKIYSSDDAFGAAPDEASAKPVGAVGTDLIFYGFWYLDVDPIDATHSRITLTFGQSSSFDGPYPYVLNFTGGTLDHLVSAQVDTGLSDSLGFSVTPTVSGKDLTISVGAGNYTTGQKLVLNVVSAEAISGPTITSAAYNASTNELTVTGTGMTAGDTINANKLTITGQGGATYTLAGSYTVTASSATTFAITLNSVDSAKVETLLNEAGTAAQSGAAYNVSAAAGWDSTQSASADTSNAVTVSVANQSGTFDFTSGTVDGSGTATVTQTLVSGAEISVEGTGGTLAADFVMVDGASLSYDLIGDEGEVDEIKFSAGNGKVFDLSSFSILNDVVTSGIVVRITADNGAYFDISLNAGQTAGDRVTAEVASTAGFTLANFSGISYFTVTRLSGGENNKLSVGVDNIVLSNILDVPAGPAVTGAAYNASTNVLTVTGTGMTAGDTINANKLTITGQGGATYTLTGSYSVTAASATQFTVTLNTADQNGVETLLNKNGTSSVGGTTYNIAAADDWDSNVTSGDTSDTTGNSVSVSNARVLAGFEFATGTAGGTGAPLTWTETVNGTSYTLTMTFSGNGNAPYWDGSEAIQQDYAQNETITATISITGYTFGVSSISFQDLDGSRNDLQYSISGSSGSLASGNWVDADGTFPTYVLNSFSGTTGNLSSISVTLQGTFSGGAWSIPQLVLYDITPLPAGPTTTISTAALSADTGSSSTDWVTKTASQTISGTLSANLGAGEKVQVSYDNGSTWSDATYTVGSNAWSSTTTLSGANTFKARVSDGTNGGTAYSHSYSLDTTAPVISSASVPASSMKVGDTVTVSLVVGDDGGTAYTLGSSSVDGFALSSLTRVDSTHYTAQFTVTEGGTDVAAGSDIPVSIVLTDSAGNSNTAYASAISQVGDAIDAHKPVVTAVTVPAATMKVGDTVTATITVSSDADTLSLTSGTIGGFALSNLQKVDATTYTAQFTVTNGGTDVAAGSNIPVSLTLHDSAGNASTAFTTAISQSGDAIDAHKPVVTAVTVPAATMKVGDTVTATISVSSDADTLSLTSGTIGGFALSNLQKVDATTYTAQFTVTNGGTDVAAGSNIPVSLTLHDSAGNASTAFTTAISQAGDAIDANRPVVSNVTLNAASYKVGATITATITVASDSDTGYTINTATIGGHTFGSLSRVNATTWTATYTVQSGDTDVFAGNPAVNVVLADAAGNQSTAYTTAIAQSTTIDGHAPTDIGLSAATSALAAGSTVGTLSATDTNSGSETFTYSLPAGVGDNNSFAIAGTTLKVGGGAITAGTYSITVRVTDAGGNTFDKQFSVAAVDVPTVTSINRAGTQATKGTGGLDYTVTFSQTVDGVDASDFSVVKGAGVTGTAVVSVTAGSDGSNSYTVHVAGLGGDGTVELDLNASGTGIVAHSNGTTAILGGSTGGQTYTLDNTAPTITSIDRQTPASGTTNADSLVYRVTFAEAVSNVDAADFTVTGTTGTVTSVTSAGGNAYDITISGGNLASLNGTVTLGFAGGQNIADGAGNALSSTTPTGTANTTYAVDNTAPTVTSITRQTPSASPTNRDSVTWRVTFSEAASNVDASDFSVSGTTGTVTNVVSAGGNSYDVTVSGGNLASLEGTVTLAFAGGQNIADSAGNALAVTTPTGTNDATFAIDNTAPGTPTLTAVGGGTSTSVTISGVAEANASVNIYDGTTLLRTVTADGTGAYTYTATLTVATHTLTATASDPAGNESAASTPASVTIKEAPSSATPVTAVVQPANPTGPGAVAPTGNGDGGSAQLVTTVREPMVTDKPAGMETVVRTVNLTPGDTAGSGFSLNSGIVSSGGSATGGSSGGLGGGVSSALGDTRTAGGGTFQVALAGRAPGGGDALVVNTRVPDAVVDAGTRISVTVPGDAFAHTRADATVTLTATRGDGAVLPGWMSFNPRTGTFEGTPPPNFRGEVVVKVTARDNDGRQVVQTFKIVVGQGQGAVAPREQGGGRTGEAPRPVGRPSLTQQLHDVGRDGRLAKQVALFTVLKNGGGKAA